ncbi:MAG: hypothetical protein AVDCRST_MAG45-853, partial [uncultured Solirubrobacterales bacterium]
ARRRRREGWRQPGGRLAAGQASQARRPGHGLARQGDGRRHDRARSGHALADAAGL